ncbi:histidine phosphatase family protein [Psychromonas antarctica]|uniref:histidine phosphatase family protein n=1 Tax=Psychromonas antarctica TaxID=67573 RepID=UPI001EE85F64|nr:histidine phosphatase family protein [Psychromonas antarctica]MCG6201624.1 histidine phosphatase family protein [Psychromonas antarctica]
MAEITLLRHPKVLGKAALYGKTDVACCPLAFAHTLTELKKIVDQFDLIITSPLERCAMLAKQLGKTSALPVMIEAAFQEMDFGVMDGIAFDELQQEWPILEKFWSAPSAFHFQQAESLAHFNLRVLTAWKDLLATTGDKRILIICHGGTIRQIIADCLGLSWQQPKLYQQLQIANSSTTKICYFSDYKTSSIKHISLLL